MKPIDAIALIITLTVSTILVVATLSPLFTGTPLSEARARLVVGVLTTFLAILGTYVGSRMKPPDSQ